MNTASGRCCKRTVRNILCTALCVALCASIPAAYAQSASSSESTRQYGIPAGSLSNALRAWGAQSDKQVVFAPNLVAGKQTRGATGQYSAEQALTQLLAGTGLAWKHVNGQTYALKRTSHVTSVPASAQADDQTEASGHKAKSSSKTKPTVLQAIHVTGTRIKESTLATETPTITITAQQIKSTGLATIGQVLQDLPSAGSSINTHLDSSGNFGPRPGSSGIGAGFTTIALRNLNPKRTLVLVDGLRWIKGSGASGISGAVDLNTIPSSIIKRVEILPNGASALYGSDAIAE